MLLPPLILALASAAAAASPTLVLRPDLPTPAFTKTVAAVCGLAQCDMRSADDVAKLTGAVRARRYAAVVVQVRWRETPPGRAAALFVRRRPLQKAAAA